jgi:xylan 1,4-beta-xylosidase
MKPILPCLPGLLALAALASGAAEVPPAIPAERMQAIYDEARTPHKVGIVVQPPAGKKVDCPTVFRHGAKWFMIYVQLENDPQGYTTQLASSDDLLNWQALGTIVPRGAAGAWDAANAAGGVALFDTAWGGSNGLLAHDGRYWLSYLGGSKPGYETPPLAISLASTADPSQPQPWQKLPSPVLRPDDPGARWFETDTLFKSYVFRDDSRTLGAPFVMFYNARAPKESERIGIAVSEDLRSWQRHGDAHVLENRPTDGAKHKGISGDPQIVRMGELWVMFYFGAFWKPGAFDTFAASRDLVHWTKWEGPHLIEPSSPWDAQFAHKPWLVKHDDVVYHFYCSVDKQDHRAIALATSKPVAKLRAATAADSFPVNIRVDAAKSLGPLKPIWRFFGADEPNYAYLPNGAKLLGELGALKPDQVYFRTHNLLCTGDGTPALKWGSTGVYREDTQGNALYDWTILDRIFDAYRERGVRPYAQIGFMPKDLSTRPEPYQHQWTPQLRYEEIYTGWAFPPKDYQKWGALVEAWVRHAVERYGRAEVEQWFWEVWNEPNIRYWRSTPEEFHRLHDFAIAAVRRALPTARVGGPDVAGSGGKFMEGFLEHCLRGTNYATGQRGTPLDFVAFHAKGSPTYTNGHVRMGLANHLRTVDDGLRIIASFPELKATPIVIGESDPEGCAACQGPQLGYRNGTMYSSYTAASFPRKLDLAGRRGVNLEGALTWAFTFEDQPLFAGFRQLATGGLDLPVLNVFRMFSRMNGQRVEVRSDRELPLDALLKHGVGGQPDVSALASFDGRRLSVLVWHYHDDDLPGPAAEVTLQLDGLAGLKESARLTHYRIDAEHSNAYAAWQRLGSKPKPAAEEMKALVAAGQLQTLGAPEEVRLTAGGCSLQFRLPRQGVSLLVLE